MALIKCPECKKKISSEAKHCPNCGFPLNGIFLNTRNQKNSPDKKRLKEIWQYIYKFKWFNDLSDWMENIPVIGTFLCGLVGLFVCFLGLGILGLIFYGLYQVHYLVGFIIFFGCGGVLNFFLRKRWIFWMYIAIILFILVVMITNM